MPTAAPPAAGGTGTYTASSGQRPPDAVNINSFHKGSSEKIIVTLSHVNERAQKGFIMCNEGVC